MKHYKYALYLKNYNEQLNCGKGRKNDAAEI
jgi:hypothetical protein